MNENHAGDSLEAALSAVKAAVPEPTRQAAQKRAFLAAAQTTTHTASVDSAFPQMHSTRLSLRRPSREARVTSRLLLACATFAAAVIGLLALLPSLNQDVTLTVLEATPTNPMSSLANLQPITPDNAARLERLMVLGRGAINTLEYAPDGETLAVATTTGVYLHDTASWEREPVLLGDQGGNVTTLAYSDDGTRLATAYTDGVRVWDAQQNQVLVHITESLADSANVTLLDFSADGQTLRAFACPEPINRLTCDDYHIYVWDIATGETWLDFPVNQKLFPGMTPPVFSPDDQWVVIADAPGNIMFYDMNTGGVVLTFAIKYTMTVNDMVFTLDSQHLILIGAGFGGQGGQATYWRVQDLIDHQPHMLSELTPVRTVQINNSIVSQAAWTGEHEWILSATADMVTLRDAASETIVQTFASRITSMSAEVRLSPDAQTVIVRTPGSMLQIWDVVAGTLTTEITAYGSRGNTAQFDSSRSVMLNIPGYSEGVMHIWSLDGTTPADAPNPTTIMIQADGGSIPVSDAALYETEDGQRIVAYMGDIYVPERTRGIWRYNLEALSTAFWMESDQFTRGRPSFRADGTMQRLREAGNSRRWLVINTPVGDEYTRTLELGSDDALRSSAAFSPDGRLLVASICQNWSFCNADEIRIWDTLTGRLLARLDLKIIGLAVRSNDVLYFSPDGRYLAAHTCYRPALDTLSDQRVCYDGKVRLWDTAPVYHHLEQLLPPEVTPEAGSEAFDGESDIPPLPIDLNLENYPYGLSAGAFSPMNADGSYLLAVTDNQQMTLYIFNPETSETSVLRTLTHADPPPTFDVKIAPSGVTTATFSLDGTLLAISGDGTIQLWGVSEG